MTQSTTKSIHQKFHQTVRIFLSNLAERRTHKRNEKKRKYNSSFAISRLWIKQRSR